MEATVRHIFPKEKKTPNLYYLIAVCLLSVLILRCKTKGVEATHPKSDTVKTVCLYRTPLDGRLLLDYVIRITNDTVKLVGEKGKKMRDTLYFTPSVQPMKKDGKDVLDSLGKPKMELIWQPHPNSLIITDFKANIPLQ